MSGSIDTRAQDRPRAQVRVQHSLAAALALACLLLTAAGATADGASAAGKTEGWTRVVTGGLTDPNNTYAPSYARFRDHLHLSTVASPVSEAYSGSDMVGGEIWRSAEGTAGSASGSRASAMMRIAVAPRVVHVRERVLPPT